ncbi:hypothetical protein MASR2M64_07680 [Candidatus Cloacimonadota bacterium]
MTSQDLIMRFVSTFPSFYTLDTVVECTGLEYKEVAIFMKALVTCDVIRRVSQKEQIYVTKKSYSAEQVRTVHSKNWVFNMKDCQDIALLLSHTRVKSIRDLAVMLERSRQWVYLYLEALISVDAVGISKTGYYTKDISNIFKVGSVIKKGIISEQRDACGIQPKKRSKKAAKPSINQ